MEFFLSQSKNAKKLIFILRELIKKIIFRTLKLSYSLFNKTKILIIPPTILDGSFGDDLMVFTVMNKYKNEAKVIYSEIYEGEKSYFKEFSNIEFKTWKEKLNFYQFSKIIILGADNMTGSYGESKPLFKLSLIEKGRFYNIDCKIISFSLSKTLIKNVNDKFLKIAPYTKAYLRDPDSYQRAKNLFDFKKITLAADIGLLCPSLESNDLKFNQWIVDQKIKNRGILAFCPNALQAKKIGLDKYLKLFSDFLSSIIRENKVAVMFLYHDIRKQCDFLSDRDISKMLKDLVGVPELSFYPEGIENGLQMKPYIKESEVVISGRMHFGISGYSFGKPLFGIAYEDKFSGLQKHFGLDLMESLVGYENLENLLEKFELFYRNKESNTETVLKNRSKVLNLACLNFE